MGVSPVVWGHTGDNMREYYTTGQGSDDVIVRGDHWLVATDRANKYGDLLQFWVVWSEQ